MKKWMNANIKPPSLFLFLHTLQVFVVISFRMFMQNDNFNVNYYDWYWKEILISSCLFFPIPNPAGIVFVIQEKFHWKNEFHHNRFRSMKRPSSRYNKLAHAMHIAESVELDSFAAFSSFFIERLMHWRKSFEVLTKKIETV